jgi:GAF domain-containing protein
MEPTLKKAFATAIRSIDAREDLPSTLQTIVLAARNSIPGAAHVGITISHRDGRVETAAATDPLVNELDDLQYTLGEGPCLDAIHSDEPTMITDALTEVRWPRWTPMAVERGLRSQLGVRLYGDHTTSGGINIYATTPGAFDRETADLTELFAAQAAAAMGHTVQIQNLQSALATRREIGIALGVVMERYGLDDARAFQYLSRVSQHSNIKLHRVAEEVMASVASGRSLPDEESMRS